jgi:hypothetical protein
MREKTERKAGGFEPARTVAVDQQGWSVTRVSIT